MSCTVRACPVPAPPAGGWAGPRSGVRDLPPARRALRRWSPCGRAVDAPPVASPSARPGRRCQRPLMGSGATALRRRTGRHGASLPATSAPATASCSATCPQPRAWAITPGRAASASCPATCSAARGWRGGGELGRRRLTTADAPIRGRAPSSIAPASSSACAAPQRELRVGSSSRQAMPAGGAGADAAGPSAALARASGARAGAPRGPGCARPRPAQGAARDHPLRPGPRRRARHGRAGGRPGLRGRRRPVRQRRGHALRDRRGHSTTHRPGARAAGDGRMGRASGSRAAPALARAPRASALYDPRIMDDPALAAAGARLVWRIDCSGTGVRGTPRRGSPRPRRRAQRRRADLDDPQRGRRSAASARPLRPGRSTVVPGPMRAPRVGRRPMSATSTPPTASLGSWPTSWPVASVGMALTVSAHG